MRKTACIILFGAVFSLAAFGQTTADPARSLDVRVREFLALQKDQWREENVTATDGQILHDLILKRRYTRALEIGTSTGHSGIWQAWALSKTGGSLITVEIEEFRHLAATRNFKAAGLDGLIDARLADAHELVEELEGPFDFIFIDADQNWTLNYFRALLPRLAPGGCFAVHNVNSLGYMKGVRDFLEHVRSLDFMETTIEASSGGGISFSFRKKTAPLARSSVR
jgi:predicted O-methyltransferase YrrM